MESSASSHCWRALARSDHADARRAACVRVPLSPIHSPLRSKKRSKCESRCGPIRHRTRFRQAPARGRFGRAGAWHPTAGSSHTTPQHQHLPRASQWKGPESTAIDVLSIRDIRECDPQTDSQTNSQTGSQTVSLPASLPPSLTAPFPVPPSKCSPLLTLSSSLSPDAAQSDAKTSGQTELLAPCCGPPCPQ